MKRVHWSWTALAAAIAVWNALQPMHKKKYVSEYAREHPLVTAAVLAGLVHHLWPRRPACIFSVTSRG